MGPACGQALQPTSAEAAPPAVEPTGPSPEPVDVATATYATSFIGGRSPPDLVAELQVNRV